MSLSVIRRQLRNIDDYSTYDDEHNTLLEEWGAEILPSIHAFSEVEAEKLKQCNSTSDLRLLLRNNLFLLLSAGCRRKDMLNKWCYERCNEVQDDPDGFLDLWARDHYKSTIITFGRSIYDIINTHGSDRDNPCTIGIFSFTRPIAKAFLRQIKLELERNDILKIIFNDIFWMNPKVESSKWSEDEGLLVKRRNNPKESTIEAWGLIEGQPTSKHFSICVYDDMITHDTARTKYSMDMATRSWENSLNLSTKGGVRRYVGTRKHLSDTYSIILGREAATKRLYTPYVDNTEKDGVLLSGQELSDKRREMGEITFASEMLQDPLLDSAMGLDIAKIRTHNIQSLDDVILFMICDPASGKSKKSDYTSYLIYALDDNVNLLLIDGIRDRLNPSQRWVAMDNLHQRYPKIKTIYYEQAGMNEDLHNFKVQMDNKGQYFDSKFEELSPVGSKENRILRLEPWLTAGRFYMPENLHKISVSQRTYDLVTDFKEEMFKFPFAPHDDMLDCTGYAITKIEAGEISAPNKEASNRLDNYYTRSQQAGNLFR